MISIQKNHKRNKRYDIPQEPKPKVIPLSIYGLLFSLLGLVIFAVPCGLVAIILSIIAIANCYSKPEKWKGSTIAFIGLFIGALDVLLGIIYITSVI